MTYEVLSATAKLGIAAETTGATYRVPSFPIPFTSGTRYRSSITQLVDRTLRGTDTDTQGIQQGPYWSDWTIASEAYPDWAGWLYRAMIGPDQFTAGLATAFSQPSAAGTQAIYLNVAPPSSTVLQLGTGDSTEYAVAGTSSGTGPYLVPLTQPSNGLRYPHSTGDPAKSQATHLFKQNRPLGSPWPSYSLTTDDGVDVLGWPGCILGRVRLQVNKDGCARLLADWSGFPPQAVSTFTENETAAQPFTGWSWGITTAGGTSTRGVALDLGLARRLQITPCCNGQQAPLGIFAGPMRVSGSYSAIYDTSADLDLYRKATQDPAVWTLTQPLLQGGSSVTVTLSLSGWTQGRVSLEEQYVSAAYSLSGIANAADSPTYGVASVIVRNFWNQSY